MSQHLKHPSSTHATTDAHGDEHTFGTTPLALDQRMAGQALASFNLKPRDYRHVAVKEAVFRKVEDDLPASVRMIKISHCRSLV